MNDEFMVGVAVGWTIGLALGIALGVWITLVALPYLAHRLAEQARDRE